MKFKDMVSTQISEREIVRMLKTALKKNMIIIDWKELRTHPYYDGSVNMGRLISVFQLEKNGFKPEEIMYNEWGVEPDAVALLSEKALSLHEEAVQAIKEHKFKDLNEQTQRFYILNNLVNSSITRQKGILNYVLTKFKV